MILPPPHHHHQQIKTVHLLYLRLTIFHRLQAHDEGADTQPRMGGESHEDETKTLASSSQLVASQMSQGHHQMCPCNFLGHRAG